MSAEDRQIEKDNFILTFGASGLKGGPYVGHWSIWKLAEDGRYEGVAHEFVEGQYPDIDSASAPAHDAGQAKLEQYIAEQNA